MNSVNPMIQAIPSSAGDASTSDHCKTVPVPVRSFGARSLKRFAQWLFYLSVIPRRIALAVMRRLVGDEAFRHASESMAGVSGLSGVYQRQAFYKSLLKKCGDDVHFGWLSVISMEEAEIGDRVYIGRGCSIGFARVEDEVMLADGVQILSGGREHSDGNSGGSMQAHDQQFERVCIGRGAWIGAGAIVMADIEAGAIIGAGSVVTRSVPENSVAVGVPARVVKRVGAVEESF